MYRFRKNGTGSVFLDWCLLTTAIAWVCYNLGMALKPDPFLELYGETNLDAAYNFGTLLYVAGDQDVFNEWRALGNVRTEEWVIAALERLGGPAGTAFEEHASRDQRDIYAALHMALDDKGALLPAGWADTANF